MPSPYDSGPSNGAISKAKAVGDPNAYWIDALLSGSKWGAGPVGQATVVTYSFADANSVWSSYPNNGAPFRADYQGFNAEQREATREILATISAVSNLTFVEVAETSTAVGDIRYGFTTTDSGGFAQYPGTYASNGDVWLNAAYANHPKEYYEAGNYGAYLLVHETGHALGLKHPFNGSDPLAPADAVRSNSMEAYAQIPGDASLWSNYYPTTPMYADILALQYLYGANTTTNAGDTVYNYAGNQVYREVIYDTGGTDTVSYAGNTDAAVIDLNAGRWSQVGEPLRLGSNNTVDANTVRIAAGVSIENAIGGDGDDVLIGNAGANLLSGGAGRDSLAGGSGDDTYRLELLTSGLADSISESVNSGNDSVVLYLEAPITPHAVLSLTVADNVERFDASATGALALDIVGNAAINTLVGNDGANLLNGGGGSDTLVGGLGDDIYVVDNVGDAIVEASDAGTDTVRASVSMSLAANLENLVLTGSGALNGTGNAVANVLTGNDQSNTLDGGAGADIMSGGKGGDVYVVDNVEDRVVETDASSTGGIDTVRASISYALGANLENLSLDGTANIDATGNALANQLVGNSGNNILDGQGEADRLQGGLGDDTYVVDLLVDGGTVRLQDTITEAAGGGNDTIMARALDALELPPRALLRVLNNVENMDISLTGTQALSITGNNIANTLTGNAGINSLDGGQGADRLIGGDGDDTYTVDNAGDLVIESNAEDVGGFDTVISMLRDYTLGENVESLMLKGRALNGTGSDDDNRLTGNQYDNTLDGAGGNDMIYGGGGRDTLKGGDGEDWLYGELGRDILTGGNGADRFVFTTRPTAQNNIDRITDFNAGEDVLVFDKAIFAALKSLDEVGAENLVMGTRARDADDFFLFSNGRLFYDHDGSGSTKAVQVAELVGVRSIDADNFTLL